jgi:hypothetical protein
MRLAALTFVVFVGFGGAASAACWCTCTSGYRDCDNLNPSQCAAKDNALVNCTCQFAPGYCPRNESAELEASDRWPEILSGQKDNPISVAPKE